MRAIGKSSRLGILNSFDNVNLFTCTFCNGGTINLYGDGIKPNLLSPEFYLWGIQMCDIMQRRTNTKKERNFRIIKIGLNRDRDELYSRIDKRVDLMIENGLMEEAKQMYPHKELNSLNTVGYKELFNYFDGNCTLDEAIFKIKSNTHKYCRKQLTWFKRDKDIHWFNPDNVEEIIKYIYSFS